MGEKRDLLSVTIKLASTSFSFSLLQVQLFFSFASQFGHLPVSSHQPALFYHMTATTREGWTLMHACSETHKATFFKNLLLMLPYMGQCNSRNALSALFYIKGKLLWSTGRRASQHPSYPDSMASFSLLNFFVGRNFKPQNKFPGHLSL